MKIDIEKLPPAPWEVEHEYVRSADETMCKVVDANGKHLFDGLNSDFRMIDYESGEDSCRYYDRGSYPILEFAALARNAFDVLMRRGWVVSREHLWGSPERRNHLGWVVRYGKDDDHRTEIVGPLGSKLIWAEDPFTALIAADEWYAANVEREQE